MPNNSATGGYLVPGAGPPAPVEGTTFEDFLQGVIVGATGLTASLVRPRWQPDPPNQPDFTTDWCAFGITRYKPDYTAVETHDPTSGNGNDYLQRHEEVEVLLSFYGPGADIYCALFRDNMQIAQNREVLTVNGVGLIDTGEARLAPEMVKGRWLRRMDMTWNVRRQIQRIYPVLNILSIVGTIYTDTTPQQEIPISVS